MKAKKSVKILIAIMVLCFCSVGGIMLQKILSSSAAGEGSIKKYPVKDKSFALGTEENPFLLLEIVSYEGFAEIGYQIAGQEPINMEALSWYSDEYKYRFDTANVFTTEEETINTFSPPDGMLKAGKFTTKTEVQNGYYEYVGSNKGNYKLTELYKDEDGKVTGADFEDVEDNTGDFVLKWLDYDTVLTTDDQNEHKIYTTKDSILYSAKKLIFTNKELFKQECLQLTPEECKSYHVSVVTVTAKQLNEKLDLIDQADLIYITDKNHMGNPYIELWKNPEFHKKDMFQYDETGLSDYGNLRFVNTGRDLSWEAVVKILQKKSGCDLAEGVSPCPVVYDTNSLTSITLTPKTFTKKTLTSGKTLTWTNYNTSNNNVYKLGLIMRYDDTAKLYDLYFKSGMIKSVPKDTEPGITTGMLLNADKTDVSTYWGAVSLIPYHLVHHNNDTNIMNNELKKLGYYTSDSFTDNVHARDAVYIYNADTSIVMRFTDPFVGETTQTWEAFEYNEMIEETELTSLSPAQIIRYLLNYVKNGANIPSISILEVQPFEDYKQDWETYIKGMLPSFNGGLTITKMTSKEFICRVEELIGNYDMVYIGMNKDKALDYQKLDLALDSLAYSHVGKKVEVKNDTSMKQWIKGFSGSTFYTRYSGNDITKLKKEKLDEYIQVGYPIMLSTNMLKNNLISPMIDISSNLYDFIHTVNTSSYNGRLLGEDTVSGYKLNQVLKQTSCNVTFHDVPIDYTDGNNYINGGATGKKVLTYRFTITDDGTDSIYSATLYLDQNADGNYDKAKEQLKDVTIKDKLTGATVDFDKLKAGREYVLERGVSNYSGAITWKISIEKSTKKDGVYVKTGLKQIKTGVSAIQNKSGTKEKIRVLQIASDNKPSVYLPTTQNITDSSVAGLSDKETIEGRFKNKVKKKDGSPVKDNQALTTGRFYYYLQNLQDYEIIIDRKFVSEYNTEMNKATPGIDLNNYQMLILGFADSYSDITSANGRQAIEDFINLGKTVLFTHDTTMFGSTYNLSKTFRGKFGMDRFGTMKMETSIPTEASLYSWGYDLAYRPNNDNTSKVLNQSDLEQSYGFTNPHTTRYVTTTASTYFDNYLNTTKVTNINKGQITKYPYVIPDQIEVLKTHCQYFQLHMDDPSIVVWYSLASNGTNAAYDKNDGRNGYYIYNKGNVTYSGAGHIAGDDLAKVMPDNEVKLFVNTIIAAYRATPSSVKIMVTNEEKSSNEVTNTDYLLVDYDSEFKEIAVGDSVDFDTQSKRIYYYLDDGSLYKDSTFEIFYEVKQYNALTDSYEIVALDVTTYDNTGTEIANDAITANTPFSYYFDVDLEPLKEKTTMDIIMRVTLTYIKDDGSEAYLYSNRNVQLIRRGLFNLD